MNIENVAAGDNDLARFISFLDNIGIENIDVVKEDWGNMCGIIISNTFMGTVNDTICFNFYDDGRFRCIIETNDKNKHAQFKKSLQKELRYKSFWGFLRMWKDAKRTTDEH